MTIKDLVAKILELEDKILELDTSRLRSVNKGETKVLAVYVELQQVLDCIKETFNYLNK